MRLVNRAENWERAYDAFQQINFAAWDYNSLKESLLDFLKLSYPEDFNDFTETSDMIAIIELFAYVGELLAYRLDLNAHENFISTAERKESILRLAKLLSYSASRNIPARGLVKLTSVSTTERVFDSRGVDLSNRTIRWNDSTNVHWKEHFMLVMNKMLDQEFGSVLPSDRVQVHDVLFESYRLKNIPIANKVIPYSITVSGESFPMELVSSELNEFGPFESRPEKNATLRILYLSDGLGDSSENTGFFFLTKQGQIQRMSSDFDGVTPNQFVDINVSNCNETDVWVNNIDGDTGTIVDGDDFTTGTRLGEWERVDIASAQNVIFNTNPRRNKYEVETLADDNFRIIFGDGKFANIPSGKFEFWFRISANRDLSIPTSAIQEIGASTSYRDLNNKEQTFSFSFSLVSAIQNAAPSEDIERIRRVAPSVYYTQDRMVNGRDYNEFLLQDNTILKLRAVNRTFAGDSKYIHWHDPREYYENVKIFGDDLVVYFNTEAITTNIPKSELPEDDGGANVPLITALIDNHIESLFSDEPYFIRALIEGVNSRNVRKTFTNSERHNLELRLLQLINATPGTIYLTYNVTTDVWSIETTEPTTWWISVESKTDDSWAIVLNGKRIVVHSNDTKFWISNDLDKVITYDTLNPKYDEIVILKANVGVDSCSLVQNYNLRVLRQEIINGGVDNGLESIHDLHVIPTDVNNDGIPDNIGLTYLLNTEIDYVYFNREYVGAPWVHHPISTATLSAYTDDQESGLGLWKRESGKENINFLWMHRTPRYHLIDPSATNLIDLFVIQRGFYNSTRLWLNNKLDNKPKDPNSFELRAAYNTLLDNKMISDTVILHPGKIKVIIGKHAKDELRATIKVIRSQNKVLSNNQVKNVIVDAVNKFFDIDKWEFGETFYFTELAAYIHTQLPVDLDSVVLVPKHSNHIFGDLFQIFSKEDEIIQPSISVDDIEIVESLNPRNIKQIL